MSGTGKEADRKLVSVPRQQRRMRLYVRILEGRQLAVGDTFGTSDPYAAAFIGGSYLRTAVCKRTLSPQWDEAATFDVPLEGSALAQHALHVVVWDWDVTPTDNFLGEAFVPMDELEKLAPGRKLDRWFPLTNAAGTTDGVSGAVRLELRAVVESEQAADGPGGEMGDRRGSTASRASLGSASRRSPRISEARGEGDEEEALAGASEEEDGGGYGRLHRAVRAYR